MVIDMREQGYYWIKWDGDWFVSYYTKPHYEGEYTWQVGIDGFTDDELEEIDERRIVRGE